MKQPRAKKLSRTKIELFGECPRCFWLDVKHGIKRPPMAPYTINNAVDYLLKQEFDLYRGKKKRHPVMEAHGIDAIPYETPELDQWRNNFKGVEHHHESSGYLIHGAVDDVWVNPDGELIVVDYKATGANQHQIYGSYGRQAEVYQWLLRRLGHTVSPRSYFVFARVNKGNGFGNGRGTLPFDLFVEPYEGDDSWVEGAILNAKEALDDSMPPRASANCPFCLYRSGAGELLKQE